MDKKYTSDGRPIRILCTDRKNDFPVLGMLTNGQLRRFSDKGHNPAGECYNLVEVWEPQRGEWCLFYNVLKPHYAILDQFVEMTVRGEFQTPDNLSWKYCDKFTGILPEHLQVQKINVEITVEMGKKYTSDGRPIRILCNDRPSGDSVIGLYENGNLGYFTGTGYSLVGECYNLVEVWEPQRGEWCLFCNELKPHKTILDQFAEMTDQGEFQTPDNLSWKYCDKFTGTLPENLKGE
jgi:hypothetical protein